MIGIRGNGEEVGNDRDQPPDNRQAWSASNQARRVHLPVFMCPMDFRPADFVTDRHFNSRFDRKVAIREGAFVMLVQVGYRRGLALQTS